MGLGPTYGTVAGDPTQNLGGLGPQLQQQLQHATATGTHAGAGRSGGGRGLSQGDADVRGRRTGAVDEDADLPLRVAPGAAGGAGGSGAGGMAGVEGGGLTDAAEEYSPEGLDVLSAGAIASGDEFVPQSYVRHRSAGHTGIDPDPRLRPDPNPKRDFGLEGGGTAHPVDRAGDFGMGTAAVPALTADAAAVRGLEYTDEPKYAGEVEVDLQEGGAAAADDAMAGAGSLGKAAAAGGSAAMGATAGGTAAAGGASCSADVMRGVAAGVADVGRVAGGTGAAGSGPVLLQQAGAGQLQQGGAGAATAAQPSSATDARHLGAIFGGEP
ncbi:hypothetical protein COO60DRAFT_704626 [Scenedesmus sp. NREL 46B-D3]|nr:hypothetical protein COO60DRAFT_704626 [Scenedesmus sp. NREL 46B-D3]